MNIPLLKFAPGFVFVSFLGIIAFLLAHFFTLPLMLMAIFTGFCFFSQYQSNSMAIQPGIDMVGSFILRTGVALLGLRISFQDVQELGWILCLVTFCLVLLTILLGVGLAKLLRQEWGLGILSGCAVGICGVSAAMAVFATLPEFKNKQQSLTVVLLGIAFLSTMGMLTYPWLAHALDLSPTQAGFFLGSSIHDVAQVVGAGYTLSEETGDRAILVKLIRVSALVPILLFLGAAVAQKQSQSQSTSKTSALPPTFLIIFFLLLLLNSFVPLPAFITDMAEQLSKLCIFLAIITVGLKFKPMGIFAVGFRPFIILFAETMLLAGLSILIVLWLAQ